MLSLLQAVSVSVVLLALWRVFRWYVLSSPLDNVPGPAPNSFLKGNLDAMFNRYGWAFHDEITEKYGSVVKFHGPLGTRGLYVSDPTALNTIILKEQMIYEEPSWFISWNLLTFGAGLLSTLGDHHRKQRKLLNPVFSIAHMRYMTPIFYSTVHRLRSAMLKQLENKSSEEIDLLNWFSRTALELVGQGGLGYSFDPLTEFKHNDFGEALKAFLPTTFALHHWRLFSPYFTKIGAPRLRRRIAQWLPEKNMKKYRYIVDTIDNRTTEIFTQKKEALLKGDEAVSQQVGEGKDIMSVLLKANVEAAEEDKLPEGELIAQMATLVFAATDTTSNALSRILHQLCLHPDVQEKLRAEIIAESNGEDIPHDRLMELPYLDAVCRETLRLYPPVTFLQREVRKDTVLPLSEPIQGLDGQMLREIPIPKDTTITVGIRACNRNKAIWGEDASEFKPERWLSPLPDTVNNARVPGVYSHLMTFLGGGRACIGFKFSQLEMKVVLSVLMSNFKFSLSDKDIVWNLAGVYYPTVGPTSNQSALPLKVEKITPFA